MAKDDVALVLSRRHYNELRRLLSQAAMARTGQPTGPAALDYAKRTKDRKVQSWAAIDRKLIQQGMPQAPRQEDRVLR